MSWTKVKIDENMEVNLWMKSEMDVLEFEAMCLKAKKLFNLSETQPLVKEKIGRPKNTKPISLGRETNHAEGFYKSWKKSEINFVRKNMDKMRASKIGIELNRTGASVSGKIWRLKHE